MCSYYKTHVLKSYHVTNKVRLICLVLIMYGTVTLFIQIGMDKKRKKKSIFQNLYVTKPLNIYSFNFKCFEKKTFIDLIWFCKVPTITFSERLPKFCIPIYQLVLRPLFVSVVSLSHWIIKIQCQTLVINEVASLKSNIIVTNAFSWQYVYLNEKWRDMHLYELSGLSVCL